MFFAGKIGVKEGPQHDFGNIKPVPPAFPILTHRLFPKQISDFPLCISQKRFIKYYYFRKRKISRRRIRKMLTSELEDLVHEIISQRCERQNTELKRASRGTPEKLYDTLSSFSNQTGGGIIVFGIDEKNGYEISGVYDAQDLQAKVTAQALQMEPIVRPVFTIAMIGDRTVVSAEISECNIFEKPCFYRGAGRIRGSFVRVGESDMPMTQYEVYSYEVFKLLSEYPQAFFPQLSITAVVVDGTLSFIRRNIRNATIIDENGIRSDRPEYPMTAVREIILNALIHNRDYSIHTDASSIRVILYRDRLEVENPGGLYGRITIDELGQTAADTRNPFIAGGLEVLLVTENRFSGIPTIMHEMKKAGFPPAVFESRSDAQTPRLLQRAPQPDRDR